MSVNKNVTMPSGRLRPLVVAGRREQELAAADEAVAEAVGRVLLPGWLHDPVVRDAHGEHGEEQQGDREAAVQLGAFEGLVGEAAYAELAKTAGPALLAASKSPDFVLDRGHWFGEFLSDDDKEALIAFLKTI